MSNDFNLYIQTKEPITDFQGIFEHFQETSGWPALEGQNQYIFNYDFYPNCHIYLWEDGIRKTEERLKINNRSTKHSFDMDFLDYFAIVYQLFLNDNVEYVYTSFLENPHIIDKDEVKLGLKLLEEYIDIIK